MYPGHVGVCERLGVIKKKVFSSGEAGWGEVKDRNTLHGGKERNITCGSIGDSNWFTVNQFTYLQALLVGRNGSVL